LVQVLRAATEVQTQAVAVAAATGKTVRQAAKAVPVLLL
jgi:hypothetical protein